MKKRLSLAAFTASLIGFLLCFFMMINNGHVLVKMPLPEGPTAKFISMNFSSGLTYSILIMSCLLLLLSIFLKSGYITDQSRKS